MFKNIYFLMMDIIHHMMICQLSSKNILMNGIQRSNKKKSKGSCVKKIMTFIMLVTSLIIAQSSQILYGEISMMKETIFREYDIRGLVDDELIIDDVYDLGLATAFYLKQLNHNVKTVAVGMDGRESSP